MDNLDHVAATAEASGSTQEAVDQVVELNAQSITTQQVVQIDGVPVTQNVIAAPNPTKEEMEALLASIKENYDTKVETKPIQ